MKIKYTITLAITLAGLLSTTSASPYYSQNFDGMGPTGRTLPPGWSVWNLAGEGSSLVIPTSAEIATAVPDGPSLAVWNQTDATTSFLEQAANMGSTVTDVNRLLGTSPTDNRGDLLQLALTNHSGAAVIAVSFAYDMKCMAAGTLKPGYPPSSIDELPGYSFYYLDGTLWKHAASMDLANDTVNSVGHATAVINLSTPLANGGVLQFRWFDDNANAFSPDTMYAIDNIVINLLTVPAADFYSQNFDGMGPTGTTLPPGWSVWNLPGDGSSLVIPTSAEIATAVPDGPTLAVWNQTDGSRSFLEQAANMGSTATDVNRLLGTSPTENRGDLLQLALTNNSGAVVSTVSMGYDMKCMAAGTLKNGYPPNSIDELPGYSFYYLDGATWKHVPSMDLANDAVNSVGHASAVFNLSTPVVDGGVLRFRWFDDNANAFSPDTMYAIDNIVVNIGPKVNLVKAIKPSFTGLAVGTNYQLQVSADLNTWTNQGSPFTATNPSMIYPQYWDVDNWNQLYFRLQVVP